MIRFRDINKSDYAKYEGRKCIFRGLEGIFSYQKLPFYLSNYAQFDGYVAEDKKGFTYSWCLEGHDAIIMEEGEEFNRPTLKFEKLYIQGTNVKFKLTPESWESINKIKALLKSESIVCENDILSQVKIYDGTDVKTTDICDFKVAYGFSNQNRLQTLTLRTRQRAKCIYRRLKQFITEEKINIEGKDYSVFYPVFIDKVFFLYCHKTTTYLMKSSYIKSDIEALLDKGFVYPVRANTIEDYKVKALEYIQKLLFRVFNAPKDDAGVYFPEAEMGAVHVSSKGTKYVAAREYTTKFDDFDIRFHIEKFCTLCYPSGIKGEAQYVFNNEYFESTYILTTHSKKWIHRSHSECVKNEVFDRQELDDYCVWDEAEDKYILKEDAEKINGRWYHKGILSDDRYFVCDCCGHIKRYDTLYQIGKSKLCGDCYRDSGDKFHEYGYKPRCNFHHIKGEEKTQLYLGMELEFGCKDTFAMVDLIDKYFSGRENICYMKRDASVDGIELVFQPYTFNSFKEMTSKQLYPLLRKLIQNGCKGHNEGGIHIHTSLDAWEGNQLLNLYTFFYQNTGNHKFIVAISQRKEEKLDEWASLEGIDVDDVRDAIVDKEGDEIIDDRYRALNMTRHTLEFRIFNSSLKYTRILKNAEFVKSMYEFTKTDEPMTVKAYKKWLFANPEGYKELIEFINEKGL